MKSGPALVLLAGEPPPEDYLVQEAARASRVFVADGAAEYARAAGIKIDRVVGDLDSISDITRQSLASAGVEIDHQPSQYSDDFEKTLRALRVEHSGDVRVLGLAGRRTDHTLTNLSVLLKATDWFTTLVAAEPDWEHFFLTAVRNQYTSTDLVLDSLVSLSGFGEAHGIQTENLLYPLRDESLRLGDREGLSNRVLGAPISIRIKSGNLLVSIERGHP